MWLDENHYFHVAVAVPRTSIDVIGKKKRFVGWLCPANGRATAAKAFEKMSYETSGESERLP